MRQGRFPLLGTRAQPEWHCFELKFILDINSTLAVTTYAIVFCTDLDFHTFDDAGDAVGCRKRIRGKSYKKQYGAHAGRYPAFN